MKMQTLIKKLQVLEQKHGNLDIIFNFGWLDDEFGTPFIKLKKGKYGMGYPKRIQEEVDKVIFFGTEEDF